MISELTLTLVRKAATDSGFDVALEPRQDGGLLWLPFHSTRVPLKVWLAAQADNGPVLAGISDWRMRVTLGEMAQPYSGVLPEGACAGVSVTELSALPGVLRRAYQLSLSLPRGPLHRFQHRTASLPTGTEAERTAIARVGQDLFREALMEYWQSRCAVTGLNVPELLRASHIKPWADCASDAERLDVFNGFLLAAHLDAAFDQGFITFDNEGRVVVSRLLGAEQRRILGLDVELRASSIEPGHRHYLSWHRERVFR